MMNRAAPFLACLGLLVIWQVTSLALKNDSVPTALEAIRAIPAILGDKDSLVNFGASLRRMAIGFGVALAISIPLGLLMGRSRAVASFFNPLLMVIYPVPKAALMPVIMLWLGVGDVAKTLVIFLGVSLPVIYHSFEGAKAVEEKMLWSGAAMGLSDTHRAAGCPAGDPHRLPHRPGAGAYHHDHQRNDCPPVRGRQYPVQCARHGAIRHGVCHDHHRRCDGYRPGCAV
jgi:ABC-type nitrate/sulfonate/bicarbonate transport system permease component